MVELFGFCLKLLLHSDFKIGIFKFLVLKPQELFVLNAFLYFLLHFGYSSARFC